MSEELPVRIKYLLTEAQIHDCIFKVGPTKEEIGAVKALLMAESDPFRVMLGNGPLAETGNIEIEDVEPETFRRLLICVYGGSGLVIPKLTSEESAKLLCVVDKYMYVENVVSDLVTELTDHMKKFIFDENIFLCLAHPIYYETSSLGKEILEILRYDFDRIANDDRFLELSDSAMSWILQQQPIHTREIEIWNAVLRWAEHKSGSSNRSVLRSCIFGFLKYIRFLSMDFNELRNIVESSGILLDEEVKAVCEAFVLGKPCSIEHLCKESGNRYNIREVSANIDSTIVYYSKSTLIHCSVSSISDLENLGPLYSKTYLWAEHLWCLTVMKIKHKELQRLVLGLLCCGKTSDWNCEVVLEMRLTNRSRDLDKSKKGPYKFSKTTSGAQWYICEWDVLLNPTNGFVKYNTIVAEVIIELNST